MIEIEKAILQAFAEFKHHITYGEFEDHCSTSTIYKILVFKDP